MPLEEIPEVQMVKKKVLNVEEMKELIGATSENDWRKKLKAVGELFDFAHRFNEQLGKSSKGMELVDCACRLAGDSNSKVQQAVLERLGDLARANPRLFQQHFATFSGALCPLLASANQTSRQLAGEVLDALEPELPQNVVLAQYANILSFNANARLKPLLVERVVGLLEVSAQKAEALSNHLLAKQLQPLAYKLMDDARGEVKLHSE